MERHREKEHRKFVRAGVVAAAVYNVNRDPRRQPRAFTSADIFPFLDDRGAAERDVSEAELDFFFQGVAIAHQRTGNA